MAKMIMVKTASGDEPSTLVPAIVEMYDGVSDSVVLRDTVTIDGEPSSVVPLSICYEFDDPMMTLINALVNSAAVMAASAKTKLAAAKMLSELSLQPAAFDVEGDPQVFQGH
jgi:hypothetical protein